MDDEAHSDRESHEARGNRSNYHQQRYADSSDESGYGSEYSQASDESTSDWSGNKEPLQCSWVQDTASAVAADNSAGGIASADDQDVSAGDPIDKTNKSGPLEDCRVSEPTRVETPESKQTTETRGGIDDSSAISVLENTYISVMRVLTTEGT
ncbi:hypothetical protein JG688_00017109 [Phytophthora aleatoria]|uniref:Uncharacterized protein n=1 Tax=Phytophthora aleatoria TaxID=2496075 RepID=A0A8J5IB29_9STRA|nr:hypothetical protein JG688_00017109 [Phytophthora aleatoria]